MEAGSVLGVGREAFAARGYSLQTLLTVHDLGITPASG